MQLQTEIGRQDKPLRDFLLLATGGHHLGQGVQDLFFEAQLEKLLLVGLADNLELIKLAAAEGFQHPLRVILDEPQVSRGAPPG